MRRKNNQKKNQNLEKKGRKKSMQTKNEKKHWQFAVVAIQR